MAVTSGEILAGLRGLGVGDADTVLVHSSLSSFGQVEGGAEAVIDALQRAVGQGLLAVPTHTWDTVHARQPVFHPRLSPSIVGRITERFRRRPHAHRSLHPTHSVAAIGREAAAFVAGHERWSTPCAWDSPYGRLVRAQGQVLLLGVTLDSCTLIHGFEEWSELPWVFNREEVLYTVLDDGTVLTVPSRRHTNAPGYDRDYAALEPFLLRRGLLRTAPIGAATVRLLDASGAWEALRPLMARHPDLVLANRGPEARRALEA